MKLKQWKPGVADDQWKKDICIRDLKDMDRFLGYLRYVLLEPVPGSALEKDLEQIATFSGREIIDAFLSYRKSVLISLKKGEL